LAVTSAQPSALFPDLPTVAAAGLSGYEVTQMIGLFAPGRTPEAVINRINQETVRFLKTPEAKKEKLTERRRRGHRRLPRESFQQR